MLQADREGFVMPLPLEVIRVLELGHIVAAPSLGSLLAHLGAEVIKVEPPGEGEISRVLTPWTHLAYNFNKKSIALNLKGEKGRKVFYDLAKSSDVIIENLSPGTTEKLGIDYVNVKSVNEKIIYCSIKGFASNSVYANRPAFDTIAQALSGMMSVTGEENGEPLRINNPFIDMGAAAYGALAIVSALLQRQLTNKGARMEIPLLDLAVYWNVYWISYYSLTGIVPHAIGTKHAAYAPYNVFKTRDGSIFIGIITDSQWKSLCSFLKMPSYPELQSMADRVNQRERTEKLVAEALANLTAEEAFSKLGEIVPCAPIRTIDQVANDMDLVSRGVIRTLLSDSREVKVVMPPLSSLFQLGIRSPPPRSGEDSEAVLKTLGYDDMEIRSLIDGKIVA